METITHFIAADPTGRLLKGLVLTVLVLTLAGIMADNLIKGERITPAIKRVNGRIRNLWVMIFVFSIALATGGIGSLFVFAGCSFLLLREFVTITPTHKADHRVLAWVFFIVLPLQYLTLGCNWYGLFSILIPVYAFLFIPIRMAAGNDARHFLERATKIQWGLMLCVYCISHAPALIKLTIPGAPGGGARLLLFLCVIVLANDAAHEFVDQLRGRHLLTPSMKSGRSAEGLFAGVMTGAAIGMAMAPSIPVTIEQALWLAILVSFAGSAGHLCLVAIRTERGTNDVVVVHRNQDMMGRVISLCFAAPVFFHIVRLKLTAGSLMLF